MRKYFVRTFCEKSKHKKKLFKTGLKRKPFKTGLKTAALFSLQKTFQRKDKHVRILNAQIKNFNLRK